MEKTVHVAVGVVIDKHNQVLIAKRPDKLHQGGLWEFPGGKVEAEETVVDALKRELQEEVGINVLHAESFMEIHHDYGDKSVFLDIWYCVEFTGKAKGLEGQAIKWIALTDLQHYDFPEANQAIIKKLLAGC